MSILHNTETTLKVSTASSLECNSSSGAMIDILKGTLPRGYDQVEDLDRVATTPFLYNGLNLAYGIEGSGKSWQTVSLLNGVDDVVYIDTDGSNGKAFVDHCRANNVHYVKSEIVEDIEGDSIEKSIKNLISLILSKREEGTKPIFVIDSLTSMMEGAEINNAEKIAPVLYKFNNYAERNGICIIIIDHATENQDYENGFKLEGNAGGKRRTTVSTTQYVPLNRSKPEKGGVFKCERVRGNTGGLKINDTIEVSSVSVDDAIAWFKSTDRRAKFLNGDEFRQSDLTKITEHHRDRWIRGFKDEIFSSREEARSTKYWYEND